MDLLTDTEDLNCFAPPPYRVFSGFIPKPTVNRGHGGPVMETDITDNDVLLGRNNVNYYHDGNIQYRYIILRVATENCDKLMRRNEKGFESSKVVAIIRNLKPPGRFLSKNELTGCWEEVGDIVARKKVAQAFRDSYSTAFKRAEREANASEKESTKMFKDLRENKRIENREKISHPLISNHDVLLGRGNLKHLGNIMFRQRIAERLTQYVGPNKRKALVVDEIISEMRSTCRPTRFFHYDKKTGLWKEASVNLIKNKVAQTFRDCRKYRV
jgi:hypothetical protein